MTCDWTDFDSRMEKLVDIVRNELKQQNGTSVSVTPYHSLIYPFSHEDRKAIAVIHANQLLLKTVKLLNYFDQKYGYLLIFSYIRIESRF